MMGFESERRVPALRESVSIMHIDRAELELCAPWRLGRLHTAISKTLPGRSKRSFIPRLLIQHQRLRTTF